MSYVISTKEISSGENFGEIYVKGNYCKYKENLFVLKGEVYNYETNKKLFDYIIREGIDIVDKLKGEFSIIYYDRNSEKIYIANDKLGRETLFYFYDGNNCIISDDFWEVVNLVDPDASDIDTQFVREYPVLLNSLSYETIIKGLKFFPPANIGEYTLKEHTFNIRQYWDLKYKPNKDITLDEIIDRVDSILDNGVRRIKEKNDSNARYGIGLSGGLDSRLIPHYALKHSMNLKSFILGEKRPHKFILSRDHKNARVLAKHYNLEHYEIQCGFENLENKGYYELRYYPMGPSNFFIGMHDKLPKLDILLTGISGGEMLGALLSDKLVTLSKEELVDAIVGTFSFLFVTEKKHLVQRCLNFMLKGSVSRERRLRDHIDGIISKDDLAKTKSNIRKFIESRSDKNNIDIFQEYLLLRLAYRNKYGAFGSQYGQIKSYSIYTNSNLFEETLTWKPEFLINRKVQKCFCIKKFPELAKVPTQNYNVPILYEDKSSIFRRTSALAVFILRGLGVVRYINWAWNKKYKKYSRKILLKKNQIFNSIFDVQKIISLDKHSMRIYENLVKIKQVLDVIETKDYRDFL